MSAASIEWRIDVHSSRFIRWTLYWWIGLLGGAGLLAALTFLAFGLVQAARGQYELLALVFLFVLVGGPFSFLYLWPAIRHSDHRPSLRMFVPDPADDPAEPLDDRYAEAIDKRHVGLAVIVGATSIVTLAALEPSVLLALVALTFAGLLAASTVTTWGRIDLEAPSMEYRTATIPLAAIERTRWLQLGDLHVCTVSYRRGSRRIGLPTVLAFTPAAASAFETALERADPSSVEPRASHPAIRATAVAIGIGCLLLSGSLWLIDDVASGIAVYGTVAGGLLGLLFIWSGLRLA